MQSARTGAAAGLHASGGGAVDREAAAAVATAVVGSIGLTQLHRWRRHRATGRGTFGQMVPNARRAPARRPTGARSSLLRLHPRATTNVFVANGLDARPSIREEVRTEPI